MNIRSKNCQHCKNLWARTQATAEGHILQVLQKFVNPFKILPPYVVVLQFVCLFFFIKDESFLNSINTRSDVRLLFKLKVKYSETLTIRLLQAITLQIKLFPLFYFFSWVNTVDK